MTETRRETLHSWGGIAACAATVVRPTEARLAQAPEAVYLATGNGRSYGDTALPAAGLAINTHEMNRILEFDAETGILRAEAGILLGEIIDHIVPLGWFLPVTPGTRFVSLGGALANDVHGKNHHRAGSFGHHVRAFELVRSDGTRRVCSRSSHADFFAATIGGMGLTGLVTWVEIALKQTATPDVIEETIRFGSIAEFLRLSAQSDCDFEYSVAWIDSSARGAKCGRGLFMRANHASDSVIEPFAGGPRLGIPFTPPVSPMRPGTISLLNKLNFAAGSEGVRRRGHRKYFYPLDGIAGWNRIYGRRGFHQHQCVLPHETAEGAVGEILAAAHKAGLYSFVSVLKAFGDTPAAGLLSFARRGVTLALDFPNIGEATDRLLAQLDTITLAADGAVNPYKDSRMPLAVFEASFPNWRDMAPFIDPLAESAFSKRLGLRTAAGQSSRRSGQPAAHRMFVG
ncbi:FAD-binding oxidoreductase [Roseiarcaceae bacterium H3SJ34-1]|uniref:FAD-binding oxidoreductase n=1 Tax=Terripilifer ovatus TaxID=3032367 RepID=UPI003AB94F90|nr:FAD-binding oxidoreductase [Roseiarcaceae bacterium H3SJ34-1]